MVIVLLISSFGLGIIASHLFLSKNYLKNHPSKNGIGNENSEILFTAEDLVIETDVARMKERERISKELHDDLMQRLYTVKHSLEYAQFFNVPEEVESCLRVAIHDLQNSITSIRFIIEDKVEPLFKDNSLSHLIESICDQSTNSIGWKITFQNNRPDSEFWIPDEMKRELCRMVQQALHNASHHGMGNKIDVVLHWEKILILTIEDNGLGLVRKKVGLGIIALQHRAEKIGALFSFQSLPGGIKIIIKVAPPH